ncbi:hypothetical protein ILYODFUR_030241 [Ilyodon furcidens]|uniref:Disks large homologue 1 N-terminal PEST domain-containing protein n=1 Tax=Ilyodon furcidens TaxID=33524 RepID=A0ABV0VJ95_9TELE
MHTSSILLLFMFVCLTFDPHHAIVQQAEAAPPSSPIIPVIPISPIPAETTIIPPTSQANPPPVVVNTDSLDTPPYVSLRFITSETPLITPAQNDHDAVQL